MKQRVRGEIIEHRLRIAAGNGELNRSGPGSLAPGAPAALGGLGMTVSPDGRWLVYTRSADWQGDIMMISGH
jgi:hypothetical protein